MSDPEQLALHKAAHNNDTRRSKVVSGGFCEVGTIISTYHPLQIIINFGRNFNRLDRGNSPSRGFASSWLPCARCLGLSALLLDPKAR